MEKFPETNMFYLTINPVVSQVFLCVPTNKFHPQRKQPAGKTDRLRDFILHNNSQVPKGPFLPPIHLHR